MKNKMNILLFSVLAIHGCSKLDSNKVEQDKIYTSYEASYDEDTGGAQYVASFSTEGGDISYHSVRLRGGSRVYLDGRPMTEEDGLGGVRYVARSRDLDHSGKRFEYVTNDHATYLNYLAIPLPIAYMAPADAELSGGFSVSWRLNDQLTAREEVHLRLSYTTVEGRNESFVVRDTSASKTAGRVDVRPDRLATLPGQRLKVKVCRVLYRGDLQTPSSGGNARTEYCAVTQTVVLK